MERTPEEHLIDYYFLVTASPRSIEGIMKKLQKIGSLAQNGATRSHHASFAFKPKIVDRYPRTNHLDTPLLPWVARACLPRGVRVRTKPPPPKFSTFVGWNACGVKLYGACLLVFEKLHLPKQNQPVYMPKALGFLSHYPLFYAFEVFLRCLLHSIPKRIISLEELLIHYFYDIPAPPIGKKIAYDLGRKKVLMARRSQYDLPVLELRVATLFQRLSVENIALVLKLLLLGCRIIIVSSQETELSQVAESELTAVAETLISFIYPLKWNHLYIPLMSKKVGEKLIEYSGPFLVGIPAYLRKREEFSRLPRRACIVDLERNEIRTANTDSIIHAKSPAWPEGRKKKIIKALETAARVFTDENRTRSQTYHCIKKIFANMAHLLRDAQAGRSRMNMTSTAESQFCKRLRGTHLFKDFCLWYHETRDNKDPQLQYVYQFFMDHEELGQEFAKPATTNLGSIAFNIKEYNIPFQRIDETKIRQKEKTRCCATATNLKYEHARRKQNAPYIPDISAEAQKFINKHLLSTSAIGKKGNVQKGYSRLRKKSTKQSSTKPGFSSRDLSKRDRQRHRNDERSNARYVASWLQHVVDKADIVRSEMKHTRNREIIAGVPKLISLLDLVQRGSTVTRHTAKRLLSAVHVVKTVKVNTVSVEGALREIKKLLSCLADERLSVLEDDLSGGSMLDKLDNMTEADIRKLLDGQQLSADDDSTGEWKMSNNDSSDEFEEDWDAELLASEKAQSDELGELADQIGEPGFSQHPSDAHMAELPDDLNDDFDHNNDTQYKQIDEFSISQHEEKYWLMCENSNSKNVGKYGVLQPMSVDYFSESIMKLWASRFV